jgi:cytochrome P450
MRQFAELAGDVRDPYPMFAGIRAETPVLHVEVGGGSGRYRHDEKAPRITSLFTVTSYELAQQVLTDHERFSSAANAMTIGPVMGRTILEMDPPEHQRRHTRDDLVSQLISAEVDGRRLSDDEIYPFLLLLLPAGAETTYRSSSNLLFGLLSHPGQLDMVRADRGLVPQAIEEALRWETPLLTVARLATEDVELGGARIPAGSFVAVSLGAANRDPGRYADPDAFDVVREGGQAISFGSGIHKCLGMHLARMERVNGVPAEGGCWILVRWKILPNGWLRCLGWWR